MMVIPGSGAFLAFTHPLIENMESTINPTIISQYIHFSIKFILLEQELVYQLLTVGFHRMCM